MDKNSLRSDENVLTIIISDQVTNKVQLYVLNIRLFILLQG